MRLVVTIVALILTCQSGMGEALQTRAFRDWKSEKIKQIQLHISSGKGHLELLKQKKGPETTVQYYEKQLAQEQWNLEVAQDLSVTDYVVLYLAQQPSKNKFQEAAGQLSAIEVAQVLEAYAQSLGAKAPPAETLGNASSPSAIRSASSGSR